jgi:hypothetical protein
MRFRDLTPKVALIHLEQMPKSNCKAMILTSRRMAVDKDVCFSTPVAMSTDNLVDATKAKSESTSRIPTVVFKIA